MGCLVEKKSYLIWDELFPGLVVLCPLGDKDKELLFIVKSTCFCISEVFHVRILGYKISVWDIGILLHLCKG